LNGIDELAAYIELMNLLLEHPFTTEIPIANGRRKSSEEFVFAITPSRYRKLEQIRGEYKFIIIGSEDLFNSVEMYRRLYEHIENVGCVADRPVRGYDTESQCEECSRVIHEWENRYMDRYCWNCYSLHRLRNFLVERPRNCNAEDTHLLRSSDEVRIGDWFYRNRDCIGEHEVERRVPVDREMYCDWFLPQRNIYVEYWGLMDEEWYREARRVKEELYRQANLTQLKQK
jgi:hypothetical protein